MKLKMLIHAPMTMTPLEKSDFTPVFRPLLKSKLPEEVCETSGLFFHKGRLWTHNDSGGDPILYALDSTTFGIVQRITLANAKNIDWEDLCSDGEYVYIGDFGNNRGNRKDLCVYKLPLASIPDEGDATLSAEIIRFSYADQTDFTEQKINDFDCEAFFATEEYLYLLTKSWKTGYTKLYRLSKAPGNCVAELVNRFDSQGLVTGADYDRENHVLVMVGYTKTIWWPFMYVVFDFDEAGESLHHHRYEMPQLAWTQFEGICFFDYGRCYITAESNKTMASSVFEVDFRQWIDQALKTPFQKPHA